MKVADIYPLSPMAMVVMRKPESRLNSWNKNPILKLFFPILHGFDGRIEIFILPLKIFPEFLKVNLKSSKIRNLKVMKRAVKKYWKQDWNQYYKSVSKIVKRAVNR